MMTVLAESSTNNNNHQDGSQLFVQEYPTVDVGGGVVDQPSTASSSSSLCSSHATSTVEHGDGHVVSSSTTNVSSGSSFWDLIVTLYVPLILLWFRRSLFGCANLIRSVIVGQILRLTFVESVTEWVTQNAPSWLQTMLYQISTVTTSSSTTTSTTMVSAGPTMKYHVSTVDPHAWPPPALTALALLTIFTLVVHPDGLTWIFLGKLRYVKLAL